MNRSLALLTALTLLVVAGLVHGLWSGRWGDSTELEGAVERLNRVPMRFGEWEGVDLPANVQNFEQAGAKGYLLRRYTHTRTNASFVVILMCGRSGRMAVHTPDVCYQGAGYEMIGSPQTWTVRSGKDTELGAFWTARFGKPAGAGELRLFWAWSPGGRWHAPESPRWTFRGEPFLYKLYVTHAGTDTGSLVANGSQSVFLRQLLPQLSEALFSQGP